MYKKVYYNWQTNKAEKCTFCYPRLENALPTVCTDTCVGRIRYLGVILYDADEVLNAAKICRKILSLKRQNMKKCIDCSELRNIPTELN